MASRLIPGPLSCKSLPGGAFAFTAAVRWSGGGLGPDDEAFWRDRFVGLLGEGTSDEGPSGEIVLAIEPDGPAVAGVEAPQASESYRLRITAEGVRITAPARAGLIWGLQALWQRMARQAGGNPRTLEPVEIEDGPGHSHRGLMLDVARHFFPVAEVKRVLDGMSLLRLNRFHWHLTDDQGWRIEIKRYPKLAEIGGARRETCGDGVEHRGYYTQQDIAEVVEYASRLGIEVIPEIELPGHFGAAAAAYPELTCRKAKLAVRTTFGIFPDIACAGAEGTYEFLEGVLEEVSALFPGRFVHLGGDEAPKDRWRECPVCHARMAQEGLEKTSHLHRYMLNRIARFLHERGKTAIAWNDGVAMGGIDGDVVMQHWIGGKASAGSAAEMNGGRPFIVSSIGSYYFDYPYGMTNLKKVLRPVPLPKGADAVPFGIEAAVWTEYVADAGRLHRLLFPRLAAAAELAWLPHGRTADSDFEARLEALAPALAYLGIAGATVREASVGSLAGLRQVLGHFRMAFRCMDSEMRRTALRFMLVRDDD